MKWLVTGGAGFIGSALESCLGEAGEVCLRTDNFHRRRHPGDGGGPVPGVAFLDVRRADQVDAWFAAHPDTDMVVHLAGQVSLVASLAEPRYDFETNALGTFNVLEAMRRFTPRARLIFASTNKVYGDLSDLACQEEATRYVLPGYPQGLPEELPLALHGGYSCSKGTADHYVRDYYKIYGLRTVTLRQSSIYGGGQHSTEDQGWVAWFVKMAVRRLPFAICGSGRQVRDLLHVSDLCRCFRQIAGLPDSSPAWGEAFNIGGGPGASLSLRELFAVLEAEHGLQTRYTQGPARTGDQKVFIADTAKAGRLLNWQSETGLAQGLAEVVARA